MELDCQNAARGVWLVKVPKYISQRWEKQKPMTEIGRLHISRRGENISFNLSEQVIRTDPVHEPSSSTAISTTSTSKLPATSFIPLNSKPLLTKIPAEHEFTVTDVKNQTLAVFSQDENCRLALEGQVLQKGECRPKGDAHYMNLKKESIKMASQPTKVVQKIERAINNFKPINAQRTEIDNDSRKKMEGKKMRDDKEVVQNILFAAFEKHQYYNIKDLEKITKQPIPYLKEILKEICNYNAKNPHKNMWELKPQFRHYTKRENTN